jgi:hypothetical protein
VLYLNVSCRGVSNWSSPVREKVPTLQHVPELGNLRKGRVINLRQACIRHSVSGARNPKGLVRLNPPDTRSTAIDDAVGSQSMCITAAYISPCLQHRGRSYILCLNKRSRLFKPCIQPVGWLHRCTPRGAASASISQVFRTAIFVKTLSTSILPV